MTFTDMGIVAAIVSAIILVEIVIVKYIMGKGRARQSIVMEQRTLEHVSLMMKFDDAVSVKYFVPSYRTMMERLLGRRSLCLFQYWYDHSVDEDAPLVSQYYVTVSNNEYFMLRLRGWIDTYDRDDAMHTYEYLSERKRIRGLGLP